MVDQHGDNHGYMVLRIPAERLIAEKPLRIKVTGSRANLTSWYMTFKKAVAGDFSMKSRVTLDPVKKWKIKFIQHSHTDIGYTRSQTEILAEHLRYIDYALDYCDATDNYPDNAKFRWTCEASWPVDEYLKCRPASQVERLIRRIREGRIEVTGMYFNFDEMFVWPQLSTSTAETFFIDMEKDHSS